MKTTRRPPFKSLDGADARKRELAQIHIAVADMRWDEDDYRAILFAKTGKHSAADLDSASRKRFIEHLRACGWTGHKAPPGPRLTKQQWLVQKLWRDLGKAGALTDPSDTALNTFIRGVCGLTDLRFLDTSRASLVIEALKSWLLRAKTP